MVSFVRKKIALKAVSMAFLAGAHCVTEEVDRMQAEIYAGSGKRAARDEENRHELLISNFEKIINAGDVADLLVRVLNEEELYPFGTDWNPDVFRALIERLIPPDFVFNASPSRAYDPEDADLYVDDEGNEFYVDDHDTHEEMIRKFRYRKGFKKVLHDFTESEATQKKKPDSVDHWLHAIMNTSFHAGMNIAAQLAENSRVYYAVINELDSVEEVWTRYSQLEEMFNRQLSRETKRRTGLVTDYDLD